MNLGSGDVKPPQERCLIDHIFVDNGPGDTLNDHIHAHIGRGDFLEGDV